MPLFFYFFSLPLRHPSLISHPLTPSLPNPCSSLLSPVSESQLPTLNRQAAEDCGNPWNRRDQGCRQGATAALECGASEEIRAASPARERGGMEREWGGGGGGGGGRVVRKETNRESSKSVNGDVETQHHKQPRE